MPVAGIGRRMQRNERPSERTVEAFLCRVVDVVKPNEEFRDPAWFTVADAKIQLASGRPPQLADELLHVIDCAVRRVLSRQV
jgi:hypothetical protein